MSYYTKNNLDKSKLKPGELFEALFLNKAPQYIRVQNGSHLWLKEARPNFVRPYLTITNKSTSTPSSTPVNYETFLEQKRLENDPNSYRPDPEYIRRLSADLAHEFKYQNQLRFNEKIRQGWVKIKQINEDEVAVYRVPNAKGFVGRTTASNFGFASNSVKSRLTARNRLVEIIKANTDFCYFFTGTFDPKRWDRTNFRELHSSLTRWLRRRGIKYILIPEPHKDGSIHFHGFFNETIEPYLAKFDLTQKLPKRITDGIKEDREIMNCPEYAKMFGWVSIERIRNLEACAVYVSKYVSKSFDNQGSRYTYHRYFCSKGLKHPEFILKSYKDYSDYSVSLSEYIPKAVFRRATAGSPPLYDRAVAPSITASRLRRQIE